jgi:hypothetical protein
MRILYGCGRCEESFGTLTLFDKHQDVDYDRLQPVSCIRPETLGMVRDALGTWQTPEGLISRSHRATRLAGMRHRRAGNEG